MNTRTLLIAWVPVALSLGGLAAGCQNNGQEVKVDLAKVTISKPVADDDIQNWINFTGQVKAKKRTEIKAQVTGTVKDVKFKEGLEVMEGDVLFEIDPNIYEAVVKQAKGQLSVRLAEKETAAKDYVRIKKLYDQPMKAASEAELDEAFGRKGKAEGAYQAAQGDLDRADVNLKFCTIKAPFDGRMGEALVTKGNLITEAGVTVMATIVNVEPIYAEFGVDERVLLNYKASKTKKEDEGKKITYKDLKIPVELGLAVDRDYPHTGFIEFVDNEVDPSTGTILVQAEFPNPDRRLIPKMFAKVRVATTDKYSALCVNDRALLTDQSAKYVLVAVPAEGGKYKVKRKDVELGTLSDKGLRIIKSGIEKDDWIIVNGVQYARPEALVEATEAPMPTPPGKVTKK